MISTLEHDNCTGCKACQDICPRQAIRFETNHEGFWYPVIIKEKCVDCGLCDKVCPEQIISGVWCGRRHLEPITLEAVNKDMDIRLNSTSGGVYHALASAVLSKQGYLAGCVYDTDYMGAHHILSNQKNDLKLLIGSKYFQSDTEGIYKQTKTLLEHGETVLFSGAPCQIAALYSYLNRDYETLYTVDFVCRGINSPKAYQKYIEELQKRYHSTVKEVHFKCKKQGWTSLGTQVIFKNKKQYFRNRFTDPWVNGFINGNLFIRPSCSYCKYKELPRVSDLTFGDFWGVRFSKVDEFNGVSLILVNSEKGRNLLDCSKGSLNISERNLSEAVKGNPAILYSVSLGEKREEFFNRIDKEAFSHVVWDLTGLKTPKRQIRNLLFIIKKYIRTFLRREANGRK